jgi:hypothetical protein
MSKEAENLEDILGDLEKSTGVVKFNNPPEDKPIDIKQEAKSNMLKAMDEIGNPLELSTADLPILEMACQGAAPKVIAQAVGYPLSYVRSFLKREDVQEYMIELKKAMGNVLQMKLLDVYQRMLSDRIDKIAEEGDFANLSNKDTLEIMKALQSLTFEIEKAAKEDKEADVLVQLYTTLGVTGK